MRLWRGIIFPVLLCLAVTACATTDKTVDHHGQAYAPNQVLIQFQPGTPPEDVAHIQRVHGLRTVTVSPHSQVHLMEISGGTSVDSIIKQLGSEPAVRNVQPNYLTPSW